MKHRVRVAFIALALAISDNTEVKARNANLIAQSAADKLLLEFKTAEYSSQQAEIGERLVALKDISVAPAMLESLKSENRAERCNAGRVLAGLGDDRGLSAVIAELNDKRPRPSRNDCNSCKGPYSPGQIQQDRYYAAHVLGKIGDNRAVPALVELLQDESLDYQAAIILGNLGDERAIPALLDSLAKARANPRSQSMDMRLWAGYGLLGLKHPEGLPAVVEFLKPEHHEVQRRHAVDALGKFGGKDAVPFLTESLRDEDVEVRVNAIMALGRIGDKAAVPALKEMLKDTSQEQGRARLRYESPSPLFKGMTVREAALEALKQIETKP